MSKLQKTLDELFKIGLKLNFKGGIYWRPYLLKIIGERKEPQNFGQEGFGIILLVLLLGRLDHLVPLLILRLRIIIPLIWGFSQTKGNPLGFYSKGPLGEGIALGVNQELLGGLIPLSPGLVIFTDWRSFQQKPNPKRAFLFLENPHINPQGGAVGLNFVGKGLGWGEYFQTRRHCLFFTQIWGEGP